jgi:hypothetical protein
MKITITGRNYLQEISWYDDLVYNDVEHELTIITGNSTHQFKNVRVKSMAWNVISLAGLTPIGSGTGAPPEERTITLTLQ